MPVQDDERERELVRVFNLAWDPAHQRGGVDALLDLTVDNRRCRLEVEVKSTTGSTVSTARDVGMDHIQKWRTKFFVIGYYSSRTNRPELQRCLCLTPLDMEPWIQSIEEKIGIDNKIAQRASARLEMSDLFAVCGEKATYSVDDAKRLHKQQWSAEQYASARDTIIGGEHRISQPQMLRILQLRARYIAERGTTLNNPHVTKTHLNTFRGTDREIVENEWAEGIRRVASAFIRENPNHPAILSL